MRRSRIDSPEFIYGVRLLGASKVQALDRNDAGEGLMLLYPSSRVLDTPTFAA